MMLLWPTLTAWHLSLGSLGIVVSGAAVGLGMRHRVRLTWWFTGLAALGLLFSSDIHAIAMMSYPDHMLEHLLVLLVVAPLFARAIRWSISGPVALASILGVAVLIPAFHLTSLGGYVMSSPLNHEEEVLLFLAVGIWFWLPLVGTNSTFRPLQCGTLAALAVPMLGATGLALASVQHRTLAVFSMKMPMVTLEAVRLGGLVMIDGSLALALVAGAYFVVAVFQSTSRRDLVAPIYRTTAATRVTAPSAAPAATSGSTRTGTVQ